jgi:polar amino acid transport system ATP-binding protein
MAILEVQGLKKNFDDLMVLKGIDFSLEKGEVMSLIGVSGSGKTTLLRCLNFLERPSGGKIVVNGEVIFDAADPLTQKESEIRRKRLHFGMVFQSFNLFPQYTALQNVMLAEKLLAGEQPDWKKRKAERIREIEEHARNLLADMGLQDRMNNYPHQLSGGQCQRVAIARAICTRPKLLLADEPTGALDSKAGQQIMDIFDELHDQGMTIVMITHEHAVAQRARRMLYIYDGWLREEERA